MDKELLIRHQDIIDLLNSCGCSLKKWTSNCPMVLQHVSIEDHSDLLSLDPQGDASVKVLGLH